jgi:hypothetical protein
MAWKSSSCAVLLAVISIWLLDAQCCSAALAAFDSADHAAYNDGWQTGDNGGSGFGPWSLDIMGNPNNAGFLIGTSTANGNGDTNGDGDIDASGEAFRLFSTGATATATRSFTGGQLLPGQVFSLQMDNGGGGAWQLLDSSDNLKFSFFAGATTYLVIDGVGTRDTTIPLTDEGLSINFTLLGAASYALTINSTPNLNGVVLAGGPITQFSLVHDSNDPSPAADLFFNRISVVPEPAAIGALAVILAALGGWLGSRCDRPARKS